MLQTSRSLLKAMLVFALWYSITSAGQGQSRDDFKFDVLSVKGLSDQAAADRSPDFIGPDVEVRLRLSTGPRGLRYFGWPNGVVPSGYKIEHVGTQTLWFFGDSGRKRLPSSPGMKAALFGSQGAWISLPPYSAIEWVELDSSMFAGEEHAFSVFLRNQDGSESEVFSDGFKVPAKTGDQAGSGPSRTLLHESGHVQPAAKQ